MRLIIVLLFFTALVLVIHSMVRQAYMHYAEADKATTFTLDTDNENVDLRCVQSIDPYAPAMWCTYVRKDQ